MFTYKKITKYKYQLQEDYVYRTPLKGRTIDTTFIALDIAGLLLIKKGYAWDGASGPMPDISSVMRPALIHDALYQLIREKHLPSKAKRVADFILLKESVKDGMPRWLAKTVYWAVKNCGKWWANLG